MMNGYNPMMDYQRNQLMAQQAMIQQQLAQLSQAQMMSQPQMAQQAQAAPSPPQTQYFTKEISGFDEAKRVVPNPGEVYIFIDGSAGKIYLKQMNPDTGRSDYLSYALDQSGAQAEKDPIALIDERLSKIESSIGGLYESISGNAAGGANLAEPAGGGSAANASENAEPKPAGVPERAKADKRKE